MARSAAEHDRAARLSHRAPGGSLAAGARTPAPAETTAWHESSAPACAHTRAVHGVRRNLPASLISDTNQLQLPPESPAPRMARRARAAHLKAPQVGLQLARQDLERRGLADACAGRGPTPVGERAMRSAGQCAPGQAVRARASEEPPGAPFVPTSPSTCAGLGTGNLAQPPPPRAGQALCRQARCTAGRAGRAPRRACAA